MRLYTVCLATSGGGISSMRPGGVVGQGCLGNILEEEDMEVGTIVLLPLCVVASTAMLAIRKEKEQ